MGEERRQVGRPANPDKDPKKQQELNDAAEKGRGQLPKTRAGWTERGRHIAGPPGNDRSGKGKGQEGKGRKGGKERQ